MLLYLIATLFMCRVARQLALFVNTHSNKAVAHLSMAAVTCTVHVHVCDCSSYMYITCTCTLYM